jgi:quaternary ammonium compound-resistance protein SugE
MAWLLLLVAGLLEICWAVGLKYTQGFTRPLPTVLTISAMIVSIALLGLAVRTLPIGTAYAIWTGIGAVGTVITGIVLLNEPVSASRVICVCLIITGIIGLKLVTPA